MGVGNGVFCDSKVRINTTILSFLSSSDTKLYLGWNSRRPHKFRTLPQYRCPSQNGASLTKTQRFLKRRADMNSNIAFAEATPHASLKASLRHSDAREETAAT